jgi:sortase A
MRTTTWVAGEFSVPLHVLDALEASVDAIDRMGWSVQSVELNRVIARTAEPQRAPPTQVNLTLREGGNTHTIIQVAGTNGEGSTAQIERELNSLREAIDDQAGRFGAATRERDSSALTPELDIDPRRHVRDAAARDRKAARVFRILAWAILTASIIVLVEAGVTLLWQEPFSYVYAKYEQGRLDNRLSEIEAQYKRNAVRERSLVGGPRKPQPSLAKRASQFAKSTKSGEPLGRIRIPAIGLDSVVVEDTNAASLEKGPAHYESTPLPGQKGTVGIAGHRTTYLAPFRDLDDLDRGDTVVIQMPYGIFRYRVEGSSIVAPDDVQVLDPVGHNRLTMTACHPLYSASERIAVFARLVRKRQTIQSS